MIEKTNTTAFIVIKDNKIFIEKYANGYSRDSVNRSFSIAKSIMSILIGIAIDHGLIESVDESICVYIKELDQEKYGEVQIKHLLNMESGFAFTDNGLPWCDGAHLYYEPNVRKYTLNNLKIIEKPGKTFLYNNYCTVLLGIILERASKMTISEYCQEYFWKKIGTEYEAYWSTDSEENAFEQVPSGFNARAIDFAKIGILILNKGIFNRQQIVSREWIEESVKLDISKIDLYKNTEMGENIYYSYQWWGHYLTNHENNIFASGHL